MPSLDTLRHLLALSLLALVALTLATHVGASFAKTGTRITPSSPRPLVDIVARSDAHHADVDDEHTDVPIFPDPHWRDEDPRDVILTIDNQVVAVVMYVVGVMHWNTTFA